MLLRSRKTEKELWGGEPDTTNSRMELTPVIRGLEALNRAASIVLTTDSQYVCKGISRWIKGWKNASKKPVKNRDLWERLDELCETHKVD